MKLESERTAAILAELAKTDHIGHKFLKAVLANFTRPLVGGASGGAANVGFSALGLGDSEDIWDGCSAEVPAGYVADNTDEDDDC